MMTSTHTGASLSTKLESVSIFEHTFSNPNDADDLKSCRIGTLGSQRSAIMRLVQGSGAKLAAIGCAIGLTGAVSASGLLRSMLFGVSPFDPVVLVLAAVCVLLLAVGASVPPALRAASIDPMQALRGE
jgi:ABC-type lipoprotein release transport system permease subunit